MYYYNLGVSKAQTMAIPEVRFSEEESHLSSGHEELSSEEEDVARFDNELFTGSTLDSQRTQRRSSLKKQCFEITKEDHDRECERLLCEIGMLNGEKMKIRESLDKAVDIIEERKQIEKNLKEEIQMLENKTKELEISIKDSNKKVKALFEYKLHYEEKLCEINELVMKVDELTEVNGQITVLEQDKEVLESSLTYYKNEVNRLSKDIERRKRAAKNVEKTAHLPIYPQNSPVTTINIMDKRSKDSFKELYKKRKGEKREMRLSLKDELECLVVQNDLEEDISFQENSSKYDKINELKSQLTHLKKTMSEKEEENSFFKGRMLELTKVNEVNEKLKDNFEKLSKSYLMKYVKYKKRARQFEERMLEIKDKSIGLNESSALSIAFKLLSVVAIFVIILLFYLIKYAL